jgi:hypothetical protein
MGAIVQHPHVFHMLGRLNSRFSEGDPIVEMSALQQEFAVFSDDHDLRASLSVLGLAPSGQAERQDWLSFLDYLKTLPSSDPSLNGHDLIRAILRQNLEGAASPVFFQYHEASAEPRVLVSEAAPLTFSKTQYLVVSVPTQNAREAKRQAVKKAPPSAARKAARAAGAPKEPPPPKGGKAPAKKTGKGRKANR